MSEERDTPVRLSVLIPVYNAEAYLPALLETLAEQRQEGVEVIALNDGSTDGSLAVCQAFAQRQPDYFRVLTRENRGAVRTRRELFEAAAGAWLWIIDADDMIEPGAIRTLLDVIAGNDVDMVLFDHYAVSEASTRYISQLPFEDGAVFSGPEKKELYRLFIRSAKLNPLWNKLFRRECVDFETDYGPFEDVIKGNDCFQAMPILTRADRVLYRKLALYRYNRTNANSLSHSFSLRTYNSMKKLWQRKRACLDLWEIRDSVLADYAARGWEVVLMLLTRVLACDAAEIDFDAFFDRITSEEPFSEIIHRLPADKLSRYDRRLAALTKQHRQKAVRRLLTLQNTAVKARAFLRI